MIFIKLLKVPQDDINVIYMYISFFKTFLILPPSQKKEFTSALQGHCAAVRCCLFVFIMCQRTIYMNVEWINVFRFRIKLFDKGIVLWRSTKKPRRSLKIDVHWYAQSTIGEIHFNIWELTFFSISLHSPNKSLGKHSSLRNFFRQSELN